MPRRKKLRADSKLAALTEEQRGELHALIHAGGTLDAAVDHVQIYGIDMTAQAMSNYVRRHVLPEQWARENVIAQTLASVKTDSVSEAAHKAVAQQVFALATAESGSVDPEQLAKLYTLLLKSETVKQNSQRIAIMQTRAAETLLDKALSDEVQRIVGDDSSRADKISRLTHLLFGDVS